MDNDRHQQIWQIMQTLMQQQDQNVQIIGGTLAMDQDQDEDEDIIQINNSIDYKNDDINMFIERNESLKEEFIQQIYNYIKFAFKKMQPFKYSSRLRDPMGLLKNPVQDGFLNIQNITVSKCINCKQPKQDYVILSCTHLICGVCNQKTAQITQECPLPHCKKSLLQQNIKFKSRQTSTPLIREDLPVMFSIGQPIYFRYNFLDEIFEKMKGKYTDIYLQNKLECIVKEAISNHDVQKLDLITQKIMTSPQDILIMVENEENKDLQDHFMCFETPWTEEKGDQIQLLLDYFDKNDNPLLLDIYDKFLYEQMSHQSCQSVQKEYEFLFRRAINNKGFQTIHLYTIQDMYRSYKIDLRPKDKHYKHIVNLMNRKKTVGLDKDLNISRYLIEEFRNNLRDDLVANKYMSDIKTSFYNDQIRIYADQLIPDIDQLVEKTIQKHGYLLDHKKTNRITFLRYLDFETCEPIQIGKDYVLLNESQEIQKLLSESIQRQKK